MSILVVRVLLILSLGMAWWGGVTPSASHAQNPSTPSQAAIDEWWVLLTADFGITPAFPAEWQAQNASEVQQLFEGLANVYYAAELVASQLWVLDGSPTDITPQAHFRQHFDRANISLDRTFHLPASYGGNTAPQYGNGEVIGYMIQLTPLGLSQPFTFAHEMGHVVDAMLNDEPQRQHVAMLGGVVGSTGWLPGRGYRGNELLFPRAAAGANEDFADTFGQMMMGNLYFNNSTAPRWLFMVTHTHYWLAAIRQLPA